jgi:hypothetical protein
MTSKLGSLKTKKHSKKRGRVVTHEYYIFLVRYVLRKENKVERFGMGYRA